MAARRWVFVVCVLQLGCGGDPPAAPTTSSPARPGSVIVTGRVLESRAGNPVPDVFVVLRRSGESLQPRETTDAQGIFQFIDVRPGDVTVNVSKSGYEGQARDLTLTTDTQLVFRMVPRLYLLSGRVTELGTARPLAGATVTALDGPNASRSAVTDSDGAYSMVDLEYSGFPIRVRLAGYDSVFAGIGLSGDMVRNFELRRAEQSLTGTWTGTLAMGPNRSQHLDEVALTHSTAVVEARVFNSSCSFSGTLRDPSAIGAMTALVGTVTCNVATGPVRGPINCRGTGDFTGTVNWSTLRITAPTVSYACTSVEAHPVTFSLVRQQ